MSLNCWCNVSTSSKLPNLYKVHNETPADQHFTSNRRSVVRNSVLVLFLDDSELPVVYAWVCVPAPFLCRHFPNKKRHSLSQEVIIHSVISWGVFFFFPYTRGRSLWRKHTDYSLELFYFIHLLIYQNITLNVTAPNVCFCFCQVVQVLIRAVGLYQRRRASARLCNHETPRWTFYLWVNWLHDMDLVWISWIDSLHCRHFDLSLQGEHS